MTEVGNNRLLGTRSIPAIFSPGWRPASLRRLILADGSAAMPPIASVFVQCGKSMVWPINNGLMQCSKKAPYSMTLSAAYPTLFENRGDLMRQGALAPAGHQGQQIVG
jgi:hypothetical protein